ncbi:twin-arginine translocation signal domain-containing protein, partial [Mesorhizobium sp. M7A.T.Ca.TU.009.02.1.1]
MREQPARSTTEGTQRSFTRRKFLFRAAAIGIAAGPATAYAADVLNVG